MFEWIPPVSGIFIPLTLLMAILFYFTTVLKLNGNSSQGLEIKLATGVLLTLGLLKFQETFPLLLGRFSSYSLYASLCNLIYFGVAILLVWGIHKLVAVDKTDRTTECQFLAWNTFIYAALGCGELLIAVHEAIPHVMREGRNNLTEVFLAFGVTVVYWGMAAGFVVVSRKIREKAAVTATE